MDEYTANSITAAGIYDAYAAGVTAGEWLEFKRGLSEIKEERKEARDAGNDPGERRDQVEELLDSLGVSDAVYRYLLGTEYKLN